MSNRAVVEKYYDKMADDVEGSLSCFTAKAEYVTPMGAPAFPDGVREMFKGFNISFPGHTHTIKNWVEQGNQIAAEGVWAGKHQGSMVTPSGTVPATGKDVSLPFGAVFQFEKGKISSCHIYFDMVGFMGQLGLGPK
jgi:predicted ester cyclase